jgi:serine/threonine protein kinase
MSHVNTLRRMNPNATEFNHLIKLFSAMNDNSCLYIMTPYCSGGSLQVCAYYLYTLIYMIHIYAYM